MMPMAPLRFVTCAAAMACVVGLSLPSAAGAAPTATGDFNGDGESDLAIGAPLDSVAGQRNAGAVNIIYGSARAGLREDPDRQITQAMRGVRGAADPDDPFGGALASADFDGDGFGDLAVGSPGEDVSGVAGAGVVHVFYGARRGLTLHDDLFGQGFTGVAGTREARQHFGAALAVGDFDGNGRDDLAVGVPDDSVGGARGAGAVNVLYSTRSGVRAGADQIWTQDSPGIEGLAAHLHRFGASLAAGDLDGDGEDDLAIGIPGGRVAGAGGAGAVSVLYGSRGRLSERRNQLWSQGAVGIRGAPEHADAFGWSLAMGDFDQDRDMDLAVGTAFEDLGGVVDAGAVNILYGAARGLRGTDEMVHQGSRGIKGSREDSDHFGEALAAGDFDRDGEDDLAVGTAFEDVGDATEGGAVNVLYGSERSGISSRDDFWHQGSRGIKGRLEPFDTFGSSVGTGDFDGDGRWDLVAAAPRDSVRGFADAGAINVIYGNRGGLREDRDELWTQGTPGIKGTVGDDHFGAALTSGAPVR